MRRRLCEPGPRLSRRRGEGCRRGGRAAGASAARGATPAWAASGSRGRGAGSTAPPARPARGRGGAAARWTTGGAAQPPPPLSVLESAAPRRRRPRLRSPASPRARLPARPPGPPPAAAAAESAVPLLAFQVGVLAEGTAGADTAVPAPRPGGIVRVRRAEDSEGRAGGQPSFGPWRRHRPLRVPLTGKPGRRGRRCHSGPMAKVGGGVWVKVPRSPPSLPPRCWGIPAAWLSRPHSSALPGAPAPPGCRGLKLGPGEGLM